MTIPVNYRVKWTANQRLDLADLVDDQAGAMQRLGSAMLGISSYSSSNAVGAKGEVFSGFSITQGPGTRTVRITGEGLAVDANGNMLFKTTVSDPFTPTLTSSPDTHIVHAYYAEADSTNAARRFWNSGVEETQTVATHIESNVGLYVTSSNPTANPVDSDGSGHPTIALWRVRFDGDTLVVLEDLRPRQQVLAASPVPNGALDGPIFMMAQNITSIDQWTRGAYGINDVLVLTPSNPDQHASIWMLDGAYVRSDGTTAPAARLWTYVANGNVTETLTITGNGVPRLWSGTGAMYLGSGGMTNDVLLSAAGRTTHSMGATALYGNVSVGSGTATHSIDHTGAGTMAIGGTSANSVELGRAGKNTEVKGNLIVGGNLVVNSGPIGIVCAGRINGTTGAMIATVGSIITGSSRIGGGSYQIPITGLTENAIVIAQPMSAFNANPAHVLCIPQAGVLYLAVYNASGTAQIDADVSFHVTQL